MDELKIETGIPVPARNRTVGISDALQKLNVGDSVVVPKACVNGAYTTATRFGIKVCNRSISKTEARIWRIA